MVEWGEAAALLGLYGVGVGVGEWVVVLQKWYFTHSSAGGGPCK